MRRAIWCRLTGKTLRNLQFFRIFRDWGSPVDGARVGQASAKCHGLIAKASHSLPRLTVDRVEFRGDVMPGSQTNLARPHFTRPDPSIDWWAMPQVSDDECLVRLERAVQNHDPESLDEVAWLIGRLAVPIE
jgi:hypothetical protein